MSFQLRLHPQAEALIGKLEDQSIAKYCGAISASDTDSCIAAAYRVS